MLRLGRRISIVVFCSIIAAEAWAGDYSEWSISLPPGQRDFHGDYDEDGCANGLEYVLGTDPMTAEPPEPVPGIRARSAGSRILPEIELELDMDAGGDVLLRLESSPDLQTWAPVLNRYGSHDWIVHEGVAEEWIESSSRRLRWSETETSAGDEVRFYRFAVELLEDLDRDADGMSDQWEEQFGLDPDRSDSSEDPDGDDLTNGEEFAAGTNPHRNDSDGDGLADGLEMARGTDPADGESPVSGAEPSAVTGLMVYTP